MNNMNNVVALGDPFPGPKIYHIHRCGMFVDCVVVFLPRYATQSAVFIALASRLSVDFVRVGWSWSRDLWCMLVFSL